MHKKIIRGTVYYYTSIRENGRIKTIYLGRNEEEASERERRLKNKGSSAGPSAIKNFFSTRLPIYLSIVILIAFGFSFLRGYYVGYVTVTGPEIYSPNEKLTGSMNMTFPSGELYPKGSVVEVSLEEQTVQIDLSTLISESGTDIGYGPGEYYVSGSDISGYGEGFGVPGERTVYPEIGFDYILSCYSGNETVQQEMTGVCSAAEPYVMQIPENLTDCNLSMTSVSMRNENANESLVHAALENNSVVVITAYSEVERGFGKGFAGAGEGYASIDIGRFNITIPDKNGEFVMTARVIYNNTVLQENSKNITVSLPLLNITPPAEVACEDNDKDGYDTCHQPIDCDDNDPDVHPGAKEICGNGIDEDCDGAAEPCVTLAEAISSRETKFVNEEVVKEIGAKGHARVIVKFKDASKKAEMQKEIKPETEGNNFVAATLNEQDMIGLVSQFGGNDIEAVQIDHPVKLALDDAVNQTGVNLVWASNVTGRGQTVCVVDSGIDYNHPDLSDKYIGGYDFANGDSDPMDDYGHGTYVSGIVSGIAPGAKIVAAKAFGSDGTAYESAILEGLDYCMQNKDAYNITVMLMPFAGGTFNTSCYCDSNLMANEANFAVSQGIFAVAASGNDGSAYLKAPACGSNVTSVGAVDKSDSIAGFSDIEPLLDMLAPGAGVSSAKMGGGYETRSGTSAAAAVAAGIASLMLENENLSPLDIQYRLRSTGVIIQHQGTGYPRVDAYGALTNNVTNSPAEQEGVQCEGIWEASKAAADVIDGGSGTTCDASNKCLLIQNSASSVKARFDKNGNVDVKGSYSYSQSSLTPPAGSFIIRNPTTTVLYIDSSGNLATKGQFYYQIAPAPSGNDNFIVRDSSGAVVGYIDGATGNMYFKGVLHYNSDFT